MQLPLFEPEIKTQWAPPSLADLPSWKGAKRVGVDTETCDPYLKQLGIGARRGGFIAGISFAIEDGPKHYLPIRHEGGDNLPVENVIRYMKDNGNSFDGEIVGANLPYDLDYLLNEGVDFREAKSFRDVQIAAPLIYELHDSYSLQNIATRCGLPGKSEDDLKEAAKIYGVDPKGGMWKMPGRFVGVYAEDDAERPLQILRRLEREIDDLDLWKIYNLESDVLPVLVRMRRRGVRVNFDKLEKIENWSIEQEAEALAVVKHHTGISIAVGDVWKAGPLGEALKTLGVQVATTAKGQVSVDQALLKSVDHPVAKAIARARKVNKLRTTFAASIRKYQTNGRIHCTFNQIARENESGDQRGARYGRLSAQDPNMQQQPSRDEFANMWRDIYEPEEGALWSSNDYSQQEPRWTTHYAGKTPLPNTSVILPGALEAVQAYNDNPHIDNHDFMTNLVYDINRADDDAYFEKKRKFAKQVYLGICYGEGGAKLCHELGLPTRWAHSYGPYRDRKMLYFETREEALLSRVEHEGGYIWETAGEEGQIILDRFDEKAPFIRKLAEVASTRAGQRGFIRTQEGRRLNFPQKANGGYDWTHKALNRLIQGSGADQTKKALVDIDRAGYHLMLQVHDETDSSVGSVKEALEISELMSNAVPCSVPVIVDTEIGPSWGTISKDYLK